MSARNRRWADAHLLGTSFVERQEEVVLRIGLQQWTRAEMVSEIGCANVQAAARLTAAVEAFHSKDARQLAAKIGITDLMMCEGVGVVTAYVWLCVLDAIGMDPLKWIDRHGTLVTLGTEKARALKLRADGAKRRRRRRRRA